MLGAGPPNVDLKHLTEEERDLILSVLKRDEDLHSRDQQRVEALRCDIAALKQKSALRPGDGDADKTCSRCRKPFGWFFDKGEMCPKCKHKVCEACRVQMEKGSTKWNCILCQKQRELNAMSGQWFFSKFRKSKRDRKTKKVISGTELVRQSFKRPPPERRPNGASRQDERSWARAGARVRASESGDETSDTQSAKDMAMGRRPRKVAQIHDAAFPKDAERIMLLDLLGGPAPELSAPSQPQVDVRRVSARRYASGSSSDSDRDSAPSSPQLSQRTLSDYAPSDSVRSSFRSTSAASDGRITLVTDQSGVSDVSSPASLQHSPALSNASSIEQSHQHYMQVTSPPHNRPPDHRDRFQYEPRNRHTAHQNSSLYAPTSPVGPTGKSPLPTPRRSHQQQRAQPSGRSALNHPTHSGDWEPPAQQPRHPRLQPDSSPRKSDSKSSADSAIDNPSHFSTSSLSEEAPPGSQGAHTQVERGARSASSSSNEDVSTHRALQEMAQPVKQQAPPPPKPARMRTASSSSEAERLRGELEYYDMKDGTESSADSASTLTGGLDTGEYHVTNANSAPTTGSVANGKAEAVGEVEPNTDPELMNTGNGISTNTAPAGCRSSNPEPSARARASALLAKHGLISAEPVDANNKSDSYLYQSIDSKRVEEQRSPNTDYIDTFNNNDALVYKPTLHQKQRLNLNDLPDNDYAIINTPSFAKKRTRFADYEVILSDSEGGQRGCGGEEVLSTSAESLEWDRVDVPPPSDPRVLQQHESALAHSGVGVHPSLKIHSPVESSFQWSAAGEEAGVERSRAFQEEDAYYLEIDVDNLQRPPRPPGGATSDDSLSDSLSVITELTEPEDNDQHTEGPERGHPDHSEPATTASDQRRASRAKREASRVEKEAEFNRMVRLNRTDSYNPDEDINLSAFVEEQNTIKNKRVVPQESQPRSNVHKEYAMEIKAKPTVGSHSLDGVNPVEISEPSSAKLVKQDTLDMMLEENTWSERKGSIDFDSMVEANKHCLNEIEVEEIMVAYSPDPVPWDKRKPRQQSTEAAENTGTREAAQRRAVLSPPSSDEGYDSLRVQARAAEQARTNSASLSPSKPKRTKVTQTTMTEFVRDPEHERQRSKKDRDTGPIDNSHTKSVHDLQSLFNSKNKFMQPRVLNVSPTESPDMGERSEQKATPLRDTRDHGDASFKSWYKQEAEAPAENLPGASERDRTTDSPTEDSPISHVRASASVGHGDVSEHLSWALDWSRGSAQRDASLSDDEPDQERSNDDTDLGESSKSAARIEETQSELKQEYVRKADTAGRTTSAAAATSRAQCRQEFLIVDDYSVPGQVSIDKADNTWLIPDRSSQFEEHSIGLVDRVFKEALAGSSDDERATKGPLAMHVACSQPTATSNSAVADLVSSLVHNTIQEALAEYIDVYHFYGRQFLISRNPNPLNDSPHVSSLSNASGEGSLVTSSSPEVSSSCSIPAPMPSPGGGGEGEEGQTEDPGSPLRSLETEFTVENASRVSSHNERLSSVAVGTPSLRRQLAVSSSTPPTPPSPTPAQPFATPTSPASNRVHARHKRGLISRLSPSLAREGAGRNSLERQRRVDENAGPARASSRAMTEAERAVFLSHLPSSVVAEARPRSAVLEAQPAAGDGEDIDALVAAHRAKSVGNLCHPAAAHRSNLLTPFSASVESVTSFYSDAGEGNYGRIPVSGEIEFGLDYNYKVGSLEVRVKQCRDIAVIDSKKKRTDPSQTDTTETGEVKETEAKKPAGHVNTNVYVKTYLLPDKTKSGKRKTRVKKHTTNPVFNELLKYTISKSELETRTLWVTVWHNDTFGRNDFLGEVTMPLDYYEFKDPAPKWHKLQERNAAPLSLLTYKGDVSLQLKYVSAEHVGASRKVKGKTGVHGELHVLVKQARHLTAVRANGSSDPFCKAYLLPEKGKGSKQKSPVVRKNCNPQWRHTFVFEEVGGEELRECALELTIWDHDRFVSNDFLGGVRLSLGTGKSFGKEVEWSDSKAEEISLWQSMLDRPNHWVEATLLLRPNMDPRKAAA